MEVEKRFDIQITDEEINDIQSINDLCELIKSKVIISDKENLFNAVKQLLVQNFEFAPEHITHQTLLVEDLGF